MKRLKIVVTTLAILLFAGCVATAISYPFLGRTSQPDVGNDSVFAPEEPSENLDPDREPDSVSVTDPDLIPRPKYVRGLYMTGDVVGWAPEKRERIFQLVKETGLNALVINIKDDSGRITYKDTKVQLVLEANANKNLIPSMDSLFAILREEKIYPIARIVVAKDKFLWKVKPEWFLQHKDGGVWLDYGDMAWADLREEGYWQYLLEIAIEAAEAGFREIQFDYVRWPNKGDGAASNLASIPPANMTTTGRYERTEVIVSFLRYAKEKLAGYNVEVSADIFGIMGTAQHEETVGQQLELILSSEIDIICPMMYPGHYANGVYNQPIPSLAPYNVIHSSAGDFLARMERAHTAVQFRPWLQDFNDRVSEKGKVKIYEYSVAEVHAQIQALEDQGVKEFLFWNASNIYTEEAFRSWQWDD